MPEVNLRLGGKPSGAKGADWGGKALLVCVLAVLMAIPALLVLGLIMDRSHRADGVVQEVSNIQGGSQRFLGPVLAAPYETPAAPGGQPVRGWYVVSPETGEARMTVKTDNLRRGIFKVPVYRATVKAKAVFGAPPKTYNLPSGSVIDWSQARVVLGFSDLRGAKTDVVARLTTPAGGSALAFAPAADVTLGSQGDNYNSARAFGLVAAPASALLAAGGTIDLDLAFTGAGRLAALPFAKSTTVAIAGDWPAPKFDGGFLPDQRRVEKDGFSASWTVPFMARGLADHAAGSVLSLDALGDKDQGVTFVQTNNPYQNVERALKYAVMFVGLVFLTFFVFEALSGSRLHPAQYVLIGLAQMVFYLLLLSLSEYIGFDLGFLIAAVATVALIGLYAGAAFRQTKFRVLALVIFSAVYALIYLLMRLEDFALLAGSLASFVGLSLAMWLTRNIDWYGGKAQPAAEPAPVPTSN